MASLQASSKTFLELAGQHEVNEFTDYTSTHPEASSSVQVYEGVLDWALSKQKEILNKDPSVSIVSWNILSDTWYKCSQDEYEHAPNIDWKTSRFPKLIEWLTSLSSSIITLQEVDFDIFENDLMPVMTSLGYDGLIQQHTKRSGSQPCAVATFWKMNEIRMVQSSTFSRTLGIKFALNSKQNDIDADGNTVLQIYEFCVVNAHLESSQSSEGSKRRAQQLNSALAWASSFNIPVIICGDFNTGKSSMLLHVLRKCKWYDHNLASCYEHPDAQDTLPYQRATFAIPQYHFRIDHMFYSYEYFKLISLLDPLSKSDCLLSLGSNLEDRSLGLPNQIVPSDHLPIGACFRINKQQYQKQRQQSIQTSVNSSHQLSEGIELPSEERCEELIIEWENWNQSRPPKTKGKPSEIEILACQEHKRNLLNCSQI